MAMTMFTFPTMAAPLYQHRLSIDPDKTTGGFISLGNGGILIPRNNYEAARKFVDEIRALDARDR